MAANTDENENISMLLSMGFDSTQSLQALNSCGTLERAIDFLLNGGDAGVVDGGDGISHQNDATAQGDGGGVRAVHSEVSQYSDNHGRSACTSIALTLACKFLNTTTINSPEDVIDSAFLSDSIREGIEIYGDLRNNAGVVEHSSVEELLNVCSSTNNSTSKNIVSALTLLPSSPRQGVLSDSPDNPMGLETVLAQCQADAAVSRSYVAAVITKPPETVLVLLPPQHHDGRRSSTYVLLDSHPRPQQLPPHFPRGSYALFHPSLAALVSSVKQIFPVMELGGDVPEMMAMMYNSFDVYPFQCPRRR